MLQRMYVDSLWDINVSMSYYFANFFYTVVIHCINVKLLTMKRSKNSSQKLFISNFQHNKRVLAKTDISGPWKLVNPTFKSFLKENTLNVLFHRFSRFLKEILNSNDFFFRQNSHFPEDLMMTPLKVAQIEKKLIWTLDGLYRNIQAPPPSSIEISSNNLLKWSRSNCCKKTWQP